MLTRTLLSWGLLLVVAIGNGFVRESWITPRAGRGVGHALSTVTLTVLIVLVGSVATGWIGLRTIQEAWTIGVTWLVLTLAFEFLAGHFVFGRPWTELFAEYNLFAGKIWIMVLIVTLMTPIVAFIRRGA